MPIAAVLIIGNEILSGRTQECNLQTIALKLSALGIRVAEARVVPDVECEIVDAINALRSRHDYVFTTGGIGPTHDDITTASVAKAFGVPAVENPDARRRLIEHYGEKINPARLRMAIVPQGATLIENTASAAPGFQIENVYVLAGVPSIMRAMLDVIVAGLKHGEAIRSATVSCAVPESIIADELAEIALRFPALDIGSYPTFSPNKISLALVVRGTDDATIREAVAAISALVARHGGEAVVDGR